MVRIKILYQLTLLILIINLGCYKDNSTISSIPMPKILLSEDEWGSGTKRLVYLGEKSNIHCNILWGNEDSTKFDFVWHLNDSLISTERDLHYVFNETGEFCVSFQVIERTTGLSVGTSLSITVSSKFLLGWLILSEKEGHSALDFIHIDTHELYPNIYSTLYPNDKLGSSPYRLEEHFTNAYDQIMVMQKGGPGCILLDGRNFKKVIRNVDEFIGEKYPYEGFEPKQICYANGASSGVEILLSTKGEVFIRLNKTNVSKFQTAQYPTIPIEYPDGKGMRISYFTFPKPTFQLMFDDLNKRWLAIYKSSNNDQILPPLLKKYDDNDYPDFFDFCNGMPNNIDLVYAQTCDEWSKVILINILKNKSTHSLYLQKSILYYNPSTKRVEVSNPLQLEFGNGYAIDENSEFWMLRGQNTYFQDSPHIFFNIENKIYFYRLQNNKIYLYKDFSMNKNAPKGKIVAIHTNPRTTELGIAFSDDISSYVTQKQSV